MKISVVHLTVSISALLLVRCERENEDIGDEDVGDEDNKAVFVPTKEWKEVKRGQSIPAGLHVRLNLQTGQREAKLMEDEEHIDIPEENQVNLGGQGSIESDNDKGLYGKSDRRGVVNKRSKVFSPEEVKNMLDNLKGDEKSGQVYRIASSSSQLVNPLPAMEKGKDFSNNEGLVSKKSVVDLPISFHRDIEVMMNLSRVLADNSSGVPELCNALEELEYYVHQIDNARDLNVIGGLVLVVRLLNHTHPDVQSWAAHVLGSASQSNPSVQRQALEYNSLRLLCELVSDTRPDLVQRRALFALSAILRGNIPEQISFIKNYHGLKLLGTTFRNRSASVQLKTVILLTDLLNNKLASNVNYSNGHYLELSLLVHSSVLDSGWCENVPMLISSDLQLLVRIEKGLHAMELLVRTCGFSKEVRTLQKLAELLEKDSSREEEDDYSRQLLERCKSLLRSIRAHNSEL